MLTFIIISLVAIFILGSVFIFNDGAKADNNKQRLYKSVSDIPYSKHFVTEDGERSILLDSEKKDLYLYKNDNIEKIHYKDILQVEIMEDSKAITQTSRSSQVAGTILGSIALGTAGALIGGLSASQKHRNKVKTIGLRIIINDVNQPTREFLVQEFDFYIITDSKEYKKFYNITFEWFKTVEVLINQADKDDENKELNVN